MHHGLDSALSYPRLSKWCVLCLILPYPFFPASSNFPAPVAASENPTNKFTEARSTIDFQVKMVLCVVVTVGRVKIMPITTSECLFFTSPVPLSRCALSHSFAHFFVASALLPWSLPQKPFRVSRTGRRQWRENTLHTQVLLYSKYSLSNIHTRYIEACSLF